VGNQLFRRCGRGDELIACERTALLRKVGMGVCCFELESKQAHQRQGCPDTERRPQFHTEGTQYQGGILFLLVCGSGKGNLRWVVFCARVSGELLLGFGDWPTLAGREGSTGWRCTKKDFAIGWGKVIDEAGRVDSESRKGTKMAGCGVWGVGAVPSVKYYDCEKNQAKKS